MAGQQDWFDQQLGNSTPPQKPAQPAAPSRDWFDQQLGNNIETPAYSFGTEKAQGIEPTPPWYVRGYAALRRNAAPITGLLAGLGMSYVLPEEGVPQVLRSAAQIGAATVGAGTGRAVERGLNDFSGIPNPPDVWSDIGTQAFLQGTVPELAGQGLGYGFSRVGAASRNAGYLKDIANSKGYDMSDNAFEMGKPIVSDINVNRAAARKPIIDRYTDLLKGRFGQARQIAIEDHPSAPYYFDQKPMPSHETGVGGFDQATGEPYYFPQVPEPSHPTAIAGEGPSFTAQEVGPTNASRHEIRSNALKDADRANNPKAARREKVRAQDQYEAMQKAASDNGLTMDEYDALNKLMRNVSDKYDRGLVGQLRRMKGSQALDTLTTPKRWASFVPPNDATKLDNDELVRVLKSAAQNGDKDTWDRITASVQRRLINKAIDPGTGHINGTRLSAAFKQMLDNGAGDLVPDAAEMIKAGKKIATSSTPSGPSGDTLTMRAINFVMRHAGLEQPDINMYLRRGLPTKASVVGHTLGYGPGAVINATDKDAIPPPPQVKK